MPQSEEEAALNDIIPAGVLTGIQWQAGVKGEVDSDLQRTGTLNGIVDLSDFGARFEDKDSGYLLVVRAEDDGTLTWECTADAANPDALARRHLPAHCQRASDSEN